MSLAFWTSGGKKTQNVTLQHSLKNPEPLNPCLIQSVFSCQRRVLKEPDTNQDPSINNIECWAFWLDGLNWTFVLESSIFAEVCDQLRLYVCPKLHTSGLNTSYFEYVKCIHTKKYPKVKCTITEVVQKLKVERWILHTRKGTAFLVM